MAEMEVAYVVDATRVWHTTAGPEVEKTITTLCLRHALLYVQIRTVTSVVRPGPVVCDLCVLDPVQPDPASP